MEPPDPVGSTGITAPPVEVTPSASATPGGLPPCPLDAEQPGHVATRAQTTTNKRRGAWKPGYFAVMDNSSIR
jgi:hypothetical protein